MELASERRSGPALLMTDEEISAAIAADAEMRHAQQQLLVLNEVGEEMRVDGALEQTRAVFPPGPTRLLLKLLTWDRPDPMLLLFLLQSRF